MEPPISAQNSYFSIPRSPSRPEFPYPWGLEARALERLALLDVVGARVSLEEMAHHLDGVSLEDLPSARLYVFDLLGTINRLIWPGPAGAERRDAQRDWLVAVFSRIGRPIELRKSFEEMLRHILGPFEGSHSGVHPAVSRAKAYIHESYHQKTSLREVAVHLGLSRTYLSTLFRRECGCTLTEYLHRVRMRRAQELIRSGDVPLSWVASRVGYQNYRDFHRNFVRFQNSSPKRFQRSLSLLSRPSEEPESV
ncbi:MAG TPA: AraC family transcriptional regulator [Candidatus Polarisedimenticolia bacterium]|nr:AraC family transcriptional regulator [Candidatus Polarisedimenticolia bacterium]